jgi:hypothetical protein
MSSKFLISASSQVEISDVVGLQDELDEIQEEIASGGGGISYDAGSVVQGNGLNFRNGTDTDKIKNAAGFALVNLIGIGDSLLVNDITFPTINSTETTINENKTKLTQVTYDDTDPQKPITLIQGELDVNKIKNAPHTAEIEFENTGNLRISCDDDIILNATNSHIGLGSSLDTNSIELSALNEVLIRTHGLGITDDVVLDSGNHVQFTPSKDLISASGRNTIITSSNGFISLTANNGGVLINTIPTLPNSVVYKSYLEANTQPKPAVYYLAANQDYDPATAPIHTINHIEAGVATFLNIGWNASPSGGYLQVRLSAKYPSSWATISIAEGTATITNKYKYLPLNTTTANSYDIHTNYIDDGALATCLISPIQTPATPPIAPTRPVIKITIHNLENADTFGSNVGYVMIIEQY